MSKVGLILSGGMAKGAYEVGALNALREYFAPDGFECVSAASVGALNAFAFMTGQLEKANEIWAGVNFTGHRRLITSVIKSDYLFSFIDDLAKRSDFAAPTYVPLLNLRKRELNYYDFSLLPKEQLAAYLRASVALPFYNKGVCIDGVTLYDGAVVDNIPIEPIARRVNRLDYSICIYFDDFNYIFENTELDDKIIKLTFPDKTIVSNSIDFKHDSVVRMLNAGYERTKGILDGVFEHGTDDVDAVLAKIAERNAGAKRIKRITGDVAVNNMNKITRRLLRRERPAEKRG